MTWVEPRFLQRLTRPYRPGTEKVHEVFGGLLHAGLTANGKEAIRDIFGIDAMYAAEYEGGAVQQALYDIAAKATGYEAFAFQIPYEEFDEPYYLQRKWILAKERERCKKEGIDYKVPKKDKSPKPAVTLFAFGDPAHHEDIIRTAFDLAANKIDTKRDSNFIYSALPDPQCPKDPERETIGWLDLKNHYFLFRDREIWFKAIELFKPAAQPESVV